ncbi:MAG TPA: TIGR04282 family arsenosugar biosynthesis glycosyltransferase [Ohtaekwangia sp.]|nr:TIGR04282 family arsenosugar biosynthesis glycosyltransferase [Ohtaekwangia sp.]
MHAKELLIVFAKNPVKGRVKTRLANTVGDDKALTIYAELLKHTHDVSIPLDCEKVIYYSDFIPADDNWKHSGFVQKLQLGSDLGQRMLNAFNESFQLGFNAICIIGTDCFDLSTNILNEAFNVLNTWDAVIGPAEDGGYYLLGLSKPCDDLFKNKSWSTEKVFQETIETMNDKNISFLLLPQLRDIDTEADLKASSRGTGQP